MTIKVYPSAGDAYRVYIEVPIGTDDVDAFIDNWIDDNLRGVDWYKIVR